MVYEREIDRVLDIREARMFRLVTCLHVCYEGRDPGVGNLFSIILYIALFYAEMLTFLDFMNKMANTIILKIDYPKHCGRHY